MLILYAPYILVCMVHPINSDKNEIAVFDYSSYSMD